MRDGWELLIDAPMVARAGRYMRAMRAGAPASAVASPVYTGTRRLLMLYGPGAPHRLPIVRRHVARGGRVAMWDLGYWNRERAMRLSVDDLHPSAEHLVLAPEGPGRRSFDLREDADLEGPILLVGLGPKSAWAYGAEQWASGKVRELRERFPGRRIVWRPKKGAEPLDGLPAEIGAPIEEALKGCSLVVCRHSNVAVDAAVAGIPVECDDGAALALYRDNPAPSREQRAEFLRRLSWWNWSIDEAPAAWRWVEKVCA